MQKKIKKKEWRKSDALRTHKTLQQQPNCKNNSTLLIYSTIESRILSDFFQVSFENFQISARMG